MRAFFTLLILAAAGCIVDRPYEREPEPTVAAPPPPSPDTVPPDSSYTVPPPPAGSVIADEDIFYNDLSPYGTWTYVAPYGRVWIPAVGWGWRPYYYGRWVLTDWGWTFVSDDPWGWAAYHYGRWNFAIGVGWYWIPGTIWGPAWVSWRYGGGYAAWCPLGPDGVVFGYRHPAWTAVPERHFTQPIPRAAVPTQATVGIVTSARPLGGPTARPVRSGSFGPPVVAIQRATGQAIPRVAAANVIRPRVTAAPAPMRAGDPMRSPQARPRVEAAPAPVGRPGAGARPYTGAPRAGTPSARPGGPGAAPHGGGMRYSTPGQAAPRPAPAPPPAARPAPHPHASEHTK